MTGFDGDLASGTGAAPDLILHRQQLNLSTSWVAVETAQIRRRIVTETRMVPVEVRVEVLELTHVPLTSSTTAGDETQPVVPGDVVIVLHEEVPVVTLEVKATERVTISVRTVSSDLGVTETLHSEQLEVFTPESGS